MTIEDAEKLLESRESRYHKSTDPDTFAAGIALLASYGRLTHNTAAEHDVLYLPWFNEMTEADVIRMHEYGFHIDTETDSWAKFT